jgi:hypothetical protein
MPGSRRASTRSSERYGRRSTILTGQVSEVIDDPTYADAILHRIVYNAYRIDLTATACAEGSELRPESSNLTGIDPT